MRAKYNQILASYWSIMKTVFLLLVRFDIVLCRFSADNKNHSVELNEFIKMMAVDMKRDATGNQDELLEAFRQQFCTAISISQIIIFLLQIV